MTMAPVPKFSAHAGGGRGINPKGFSVCPRVRQTGGARPPPLAKITATLRRTGSAASDGSS
jgi:hypothetical protein